MGKKKGRTFKVQKAPPHKGAVLLTQVHLQAKLPQTTETAWALARMTWAAARAMAAMSRQTTTS